MRLHKAVSLLVVVGLGFFGATQALAARISDVQNTKHNLSATGFDGGVTDTRTVKATDLANDRICVFCHTPHGAENGVNAPLWNRKLSSATYTAYSSISIEAADLTNTISDSSKLCLSCHDGTLALGTVNVYGGLTNQTIALNGTNAGKMPDGAGAASGNTRNLGINLSNDHPISFTYNTTLSTDDGELRDPAVSAHIVNRTQGSGVGSPPVPLVGNKVECVGCHDPHIRDTLDANIKFLRLNRFQTNAGPGINFSQTNDQVCLACHKKDGWIDSAHASAGVADEIYSVAGASNRDFPANLPVWRAACLNCHDTHTVQGARMLLREGTDSAASPKQGGNAAQEESCYQCHSSTGGTLTSQGLNTQVPDIKADFALAIRMPITNIEQGVANEMHKIGAGTGTGKDFVELQPLLGKGIMANRHVECTDCHNPHRVIKNRVAGGNPAIPDAGGTHDHTAAIHTNYASGVLRGTFGVEPMYSTTAFDTQTPGYTLNVRKGVPPLESLVGGKAEAEGKGYVTREYQICLKCHSNYAFDDNNRPVPGGAGSTPMNTNGFNKYTDQAMEFQAPVSHMGEVTGPNTGAAPAYATNNHRGWHPVIDKTGRTDAIRGSFTATVALTAPWNTVAAVGNLTMYCSDCHGTDTATGTSTPDNGENGRAWGPHGSENNFLLKGPWTQTTGADKDKNINTQDHLCFKCHSWNVYANDNGPGNSTGFSKSDGSNLHAYHAGKSGYRCMGCHVAVPHGWKNKQLLVNLNDVGPEATNPATGLPYAVGTRITTMRSGALLNDGKAPFYNPPYYYGGMLYIYSFAKSGQWQGSNCEGSGPSMGDACDRQP